MNKNAPLASRGVGGLPGLIKPEYGMDITAPATFQFPSGGTDLAGPALSDLYNLWNKVVVPMSDYGPFKQDVTKVTTVAPILKYYKNIFDYAVSDDNWLKDGNGNKLYEVPSALPYIIQSIAGVENVDLNRIKAEEGILTRRDERTRGLITRLTNQAMDCILNNKPLTSDLINRMMKNGVTVDSLIRRIENSQYPPDLRRVLRTEIRRRPEILQMYPNQADYGSLP
jgi:hypothetical protein